jgi:hypothetical protein
VKRSGSPIRPARDWPFWTVALAVLAGVAGVAQQDRLQGRWEGTVQSQRGSRPAVATFTRTGETYAGTISGVRPDEDLPFKDIKIDGDTVSAVAEVSSPQGPLPIKFVFALQGDTLKGKGELDVAGQAFNFTVDLKRAAAQTAAPTVAAPSTEPPGTAAPGAAQTPAPRATRKSVPQPLQKQSLEYFVGRWNFRWLARESLLGPGARTGTVTFTPTPDGAFLDARTQGQSDEGKYQESAVVGFDDEKKMLAIFERRSGGVELLSLGDWEAAMTIRFTVSPFKVKGQTVRLKRMISVMSATTFKVSEEFSIDGGPFERLGDGMFTKIVAEGKTP